MSPRSTIQAFGFWSLLALSALQVSTAPTLAQQQAQPPGRRQFTPYAEGILSAQVFATDSVPGYRTVVLDLLMGPNMEAPDVPIRAFALMELRSGRIETTLNDVTEVREVDDVWIVPAGARLSIRNLSEVAVIRTMTLDPRR